MNYSKSKVQASPRHSSTFMIILVVIPLIWLCTVLVVRANLERQSAKINDLDDYVAVTADVERIETIKSSHTSGNGVTTTSYTYYGYLTYTYNGTTYHSNNHITLINNEVKKVDVYISESNPTHVQTVPTSNPGIYTNIMDFLMAPAIIWLLVDGVILLKRFLS